MISKPSRAANPGRMEENMKFTWKEKNGMIYTKTIIDREEQLKFIEWLEFSPNVVWWQ